MASRPERRRGPTYLLRHAASFGEISDFVTKTRCVSTGPSEGEGRSFRHAASFEPKSEISPKARCVSPNEPSRG